MPANSGISGYNPGLAGRRAGIDAVDHRIPYRPGSDGAVHMMKLLSPGRFDRLPDAVLFDTDNTLYPYDPAHAAALKAVREKAVAKFAIAPEIFDNAFADARRQVKVRLEGKAASHSR